MRGDWNICNHQKMNQKLKTFNISSLDYMKVKDQEGLRDCEYFPLKSLKNNKRNEADVFIVLLK